MNLKILNICVVKFEVENCNCNLETGLHLFCVLQRIGSNIYSYLAFAPFSCKKVCSWVNGRVDGWIGWWWIGKLQLQSWHRSLPVLRFAKKRIIYTVIWHSLLFHAKKYVPGWMDEWMDGLVVNRTEFGWFCWNLIWNFQLLESGAQIT